VDVQIQLNELHSGQVYVLENKQRFNVVNCGRRWGKTILATDIIINDVLDGKKVGYFTPTYKLLEEVYSSCLLALNQITTVKHQNQFIETMTGGKIEFWSLDNPLAGRSRKYHTAIMDEAAFVKNLIQVWNEAIRPTLTDYKGDAWFFSTPKGRNDFHKLHTKGGNVNGWASFTMPTETNPYIDPEEIESAKNDLPADAFAQEYLAVFNANSANPFGDISHCIRPLSSKRPTCYGVDLAKSTDWTVIIGLDEDGAVCFFDRWQGSWANTKSKLLTICKGVPTLIDSTGVGDPIVEELQSVNKKIQGFKFTSISKQQLIQGLVQAVHQSEIFFPDGVIRSEMEIFEYVYTMNGVRYSAPVGFHDDAVCALALANRIRTTPKVIIKGAVI
jgi:hypothetical protein